MNKIIITGRLVKDAELNFIATTGTPKMNYTLAVERGNEKVASLYTHFHPAVIRLIKYVIDSAHKNKIPP